MSTTPRTVVLLDEDTFWAIQSIRDRLGDTADTLASIDATLARHVTVASAVVAGAAAVAAAALAIGEVRR